MLRVGRVPLFVGRTAQTHLIRQLIADGRAQLITLTGTAGVGKSRLAREVLADSMFDGTRQLFVDLADVHIGDRAAAAIATAAGIAGVGQDGDAEIPIAEIVDRYFDGDGGILVLDNCDGVVDTIGPELVESIARHRQLTVVATSAVAFDLYAECLVCVDPLPTEPLDSPAVQMMTNCVDSRFRADVSDRSALAAIAHHLGGIPLALESAAVTIGRVGTAETLRMITSGADLLPAPFVDTPPRHRTVHAALAAGLASLGHTERDVLLNISRFESAVDAATVARWTDAAPADVVDALDALVQRSMLARTTIDDVHLYRMYPTVRSSCRRILDTADARRFADRGNANGSVVWRPRAHHDSGLGDLTGRQREVAQLVAEGMTNRMIATRLGIAEWTVVNHLRQVMTKLDCPSRLHVALVVERDCAAGASRAGA